MERRCNLYDETFFLLLDGKVILTDCEIKSLSKQLIESKATTRDYVDLFQSGFCHEESDP